MARSSLRLLPAIAGVLVAGGLVAACGGGGESTTSSGGGGTGNTSSGGTGGSGNAGGDGGSGASIGGGCEPPCVDPQVCSVEQVCIDPGTCLADGDCAEGTVCDTATSTCVPGGGCGGKEAKADAVAPNLLIVLDRSCSMTANVNGVSKWEIAVTALQTMTTNFNGKIRFGLSMFPDLVTPNCQQDAIPIPVAPGTEMAISELLGAALAQNDPYFPDGPCVTNIDTAMQQATTEPALTDMERDSYVLLITDGKQAGCNAAGGDNGTTMIIKDLHDMMEVPTFVLGFGDGIDPAQMNIFAEAGGVPAGDPTKYYDASDQASLDAALDLIASKTLGCTFSLDEVPPNSDEIFVFFDNKPEGVTRDVTHTMGWDYDAAQNQVTFYGQTCDMLKAGEVKDVDIVFGCDEPTPT